jgi:uncharacterized protein YggL (DUF469 family)/ABC-type oligopeptide transport system ATPase subunit
MTQTVQTDLFSAYNDAMDRLKWHVPELCEATLDSRNADTIEHHVSGWTEMISKPREQVVVDGIPALVATLFGPSGAGKSTFFRNLTDINVPAGGAIRPTTFRCAIAIPEAISHSQEEHRLFPTFDMKPLDDPSVLSQSSNDPNELYYSSYSPGFNATHAWLVLADVPDFNTIETENWDRAERVLSRSELVVFLVYPEGYADERVISMLARCCQYAGRLAFVFTKSSPADAQAMWEDLITYKVQHAESFSAKRGDQLSLTEFLKQADVYYSPLTANPDLRSVQPVTKQSPNFPSLLAGLDAQRIILQNLLAVSARGAESILGLCTRAANHKQVLTQQVDQINHSIETFAHDIAGKEFPLGRMFEILVNTFETSRPKWLRTINKPITLLSKKLHSGWQALQKRLRTDYQPYLRKLEDLERERLDNTIDQLLDEWRSIDGLELDAAQCQQAREHFMSQPIPEIGENWEEQMRAEAQEWVDQNRWLAGATTQIAETLTLIGGGAIVLDIFLFGGLGTLGAVAGAGGTTGSLGLLEEGFKQLKLKQQLNRAHEKWLQERTRTLSVHLRKELAGPLFLTDMEETIASISNALLTDCRAACDQLLNLQKELSH